MSVVTPTPTPTRMDFITQAKRDLKTRFVAELPALLQAGDLLSADGVTTPPPREVHTTDVAQLNDYPGMELMPQGTDPQAESYAVMNRHLILVGVTLVGDDEETLATQVERYMWAIQKIARDSLLQSPDQGGPIETGRIRYTPVGQPPAGIEAPFVKGGAIEVFVTTIE